MRIVALGTGDAFNGGGRGHTCFALEDAQGLCLIDAGGQVLSALHASGLEPARIDAVHFTHLHGDHIAGWPFLLVDAVYRQKRARPLVVTGPVGTQERLDALWAASYADAAKKPLPFALQVLELSPGEVREVCGRKLEALRAQHMRPPHVALSLRLTSEECVAFTGDTGPHEGLLALAKGAEVLFGECTELVARAPGVPDPKAGADYPPESGRRHLAWDDWKALLPKLEGVPVRLVHLSEEMRLGVAIVREEGGALGDVWALDDGDEIDV
ncbi:MAG: MBL fold metallo-hydrolase [Deltaproteobacteria bacterium]|nr:MBL fold metallo-hydrolase [Deltaproteobacteria bacterium]